jgi:hypothetical protein
MPAPPSNASCTIITTFFVVNPVSNLRPIPSARLTAYAWLKKASKFPKTPSSTVTKCGWSLTGSGGGETNREDAVQTRIFRPTTETKTRQRSAVVNKGRLNGVATFQQRTVYWTCERRLLTTLNSCKPVSEQACPEQNTGSTEHQSSGISLSFSKASDCW